MHKSIFFFAETLHYLSSVAWHSTSPGKGTRKKKVLTGGLVAAHRHAFIKCEKARTSIMPALKMKTVYKHMPLQCISPNTYFRTHRRVIGKRIFAFEVASPSPLATVLSPSLQAFAQTHFPHTTHFWHSIFGDLQAFAVVVVDPSTSTLPQAKIVARGLCSGNLIQYSSKSLGDGVCRKKVIPKSVPKNG